ncbi:4Fe-4S ferredoxin iron-sulfur binding domain protein [Denitrovibrio acetiphilus DSM 12809]|uniref:4Fe-4S ferredoxin iron-sulfur binding domain protein n=1 Tax=Denitrovibrio acetiphilus (strain DSM 12809 / NBRC 114555 / N2460) TaxID=522772 RepID=D4H676_DENA2|nr:4Fe-4S dicluster domain-containing protein [Denitrovibrio acetiphilus]ADD67722.1 4Fe-4S ferredoxin iron-sulfur binding domain protein [Denitrovibrio acetiphilus DSM 12809]
MSELSRRRFIWYAIAVAAGGGGFLLPSVSHSFYGLRPPAALKESTFLATCIKCGQCVQVCPYHSVTLLDMNYGVAAGTPVIKPDERGCYLCDLLPCVLACPSSALDHSVDDAFGVSMGKAYIDNIKDCLSYKESRLTDENIASLTDGKPEKTDVERKLNQTLKSRVSTDCDLCERYCPFPEKENAIGFVSENGKRIPEIREKCVGCGVCVELCPVNIIKIIPVDRRV